MTTIKHIACFACIDKIIEGLRIITPCLRYYDEGYEFPDECPKKARGVEITSIPKWEEIDESEFNDYWIYNQVLGTKIRIFEKEDIEK